MDMPFKPFQLTVIHSAVEWPPSSVTMANVSAPTGNVTGGTTVGTGPTRQAVVS